jgi:AAA15 family ATPase/GTPase
LTKINLFGGKNNVGKTSLLESVFTFYDRFNPDLLFKQLLWRGAVILSINDDNQHELWLSAFNNFDIKKKIKFSSIDSTKHNEKVEIQIDENFVIPVSSNELQKINKDLKTSTTQTKSRYALHILASINNKSKQDSHVYLLNNNIHMYVKFLDNSNRKIVTFLSTKTQNPLSESLRFGELIKKGKENILVDILKEMIEPRLKSIYPIPISENQTLLHADIGLSSKIPLNYLGDGMFRILSYLAAILNSPNGIVLIDEIENGLHYSIHKDLWKILFKTANEYNVQLFINTHSIEMVHAFNSIAKEISPNDFMYYELFQNINDNQISINQIDSDLLQFKLKNNKSFRGE